MENMLRVGVITSAHGIKGEVKVFPTTDDAKRFKELKEDVYKRQQNEFPAAFIILTQRNRHGALQPFAYIFNRPCHLPNEMIFIHDDCSVWKEGLCKFGVGAPHIADEELYLQAFFPGNVPPIILSLIHI